MYFSSHFHNKLKYISVFVMLVYKSLNKLQECLSRKGSTVDQNQTGTKSDYVFHLGKYPITLTSGKNCGLVIFQNFYKWRSSVYKILLKKQASSTSQNSSVDLFPTPFSIMASSPFIIYIFMFSFYPRVQGKFLHIFYINLFRSYLS